MINIDNGIIFSDYYKKYIIGSWIDVSEKHIIKNAKHFHRDVNQLYRPWVELWLEKHDFLYSFNTINENKFSIICLKEWLYLIKEEGFLIIHFEENKLLNHEKFLSHLLESWPNGEFTLEVNDRLNNFYVIKKKKSLLVSWDSIEKWTFWIVTQWKRDDWLHQIIDSIEIQNIPQYEIILCWKVNNNEIINRENINYIEFTENDDQWWITRKKNIIVENAKHENICIVHDRIIFKKWWYDWMKKWGNNFEHLSPYYEWKGQNFYNYTSNSFYSSYTPYKKVLAFVTGLDAKDFDTQVVCGWNAHIWKRRYFRKYRWDENLFWIDNTFEDWSISYILNSHWLFARNNQYAHIKAIYYRFKLCPVREFNPVRQGNYQSIWIKQRFLRLIWPNLVKYKLFRTLILVRDEKDSLYTTLKKFIYALKKR